MAEKLKLEVSDEIAIKVESMNKWFGSFHDGSAQATDRTRAQKKQIYTR